MMRAPLLVSAALLALAASAVVPCTRAREESYDLGFNTARVWLTTMEELAVR